MEKVTFRNYHHLTNQRTFLSISCQLLLMLLSASGRPLYSQSVFQGAPLMDPMDNRFSGQFKPLFPHYRSKDAFVHDQNHAESGRSQVDGRPGQNPTISSADKAMVEKEFPAAKPRPGDDWSRHSALDADGKSIRDSDRKFKRQSKQNTSRNCDEKRSENLEGNGLTTEEKGKEIPENGSLGRRRRRSLLAAAAAEDALIAASSSSSASPGTASPDRSQVASTGDAPDSDIVPERTLLSKEAVKERHLQWKKKDEEDDASRRKRRSADDDDDDVDGRPEQQPKEEGTLASEEANGRSTDAVDRVSSPLHYATASVKQLQIMSADDDDESANESAESKAYELFEEEEEMSLESNYSSANEANKTSSGMSYRTGVGRRMKGNQNAFVDPFDSRQWQRLLLGSASSSPVLGSTTTTTPPSTQALYYGDGSITETDSLEAEFNIQSNNYSNTIEENDFAFKTIHSKVTAGNLEPPFPESIQHFPVNSLEAATSAKRLHPMQDPKNYTQDNLTPLSPNGSVDISERQESVTGSINRTRGGSSESAEEQEEDDCLVDSRSFLLEFRSCRIAFQSVNVIACILFVIAAVYSAEEVILTAGTLKAFNTCGHRLQLTCLLLLLSVCHVISGFLFGAWPDEFYESLSTDLLYTVAHLCFSLTFLVHCLCLYKFFFLFRRRRYLRFYFAFVGFHVSLFLVGVSLRIFLPKCNLTANRLSALTRLLIDASSALVFGLYLARFRRRARAASRHWIESQLGADSKEAVTNFTRLVSGGLRLTDISAVLGLCLLSANICNIGLRYYGYSHTARVVAVSVFSDFILAAYCFVLGVSCRWLLVADGHRSAGRRDFVESNSSVSNALHLPTLTKSSSTLTDGRTLENMSSLLNNSGPFNLASYSKFRSQTLSRDDVRSSETRTRQSESLPLRSRSSNGALVQRRSLEVPGAIGNGHRRDPKKRSMLFNDNGFIRFRKESDPEDEYPDWSDANAAKSEGLTTASRLKTTSAEDDACVAEEDFTGEIQAAEATESGNGSLLRSIELQKKLEWQNRSLVNSTSALSSNSRRSSCQSNTAQNSPNLFSYRLPSIRLHESIERALNDLSLKPVDSDTVIEV